MSAPIQEMKNALRRNASLLKRPKQFSKLRELIEQDSGNRLELEFPEFDPEVVRRVSEESKARIKKYYKRQVQIQIAVVSTFFLTLFCFAFYVFSPGQADEGVSEEKIASAIKAIAKEEKRFKFYLMDGDRWINEKHCKNAIYQFELAVKTRPNDYYANEGLLRAMILSCEMENKFCNLLDEQQQRVDRLKFMYDQKQQ